MIPQSISSALDLVTPHSTTRDGFLRQAVSKTTIADPFVAEARALEAALEHVDDINFLPTITVTSIQSALLAAAGFSDKARGHLSQSELQAALSDVLQRLATSEPEVWRKEIVYRFLLTRGDTLGGKMRNITGAEGGVQFSGALNAALQRHGITAVIKTAAKNPNKITALSWTDRRLVFDKKPTFIDKNIDAILTDDAGTVIACGELKGGIDPAGADEHWKTAGSAFDRIREVFRDKSLIPPHLFFVGAAIETSMAGEIFARLQDGRLEYAANLTVPQQMSDLADWLVKL